MVARVRPHRSRSPRPLLRALAALALLLVACGQEAEPGPPGPRPDILLISIDTLRADRLGCYGHERATSPFLDRVSASGVRFARALAPAPHTAPSHMSLFTGLDPLAHGVKNMTAGDRTVTRLAGGVPTLPELLAPAGYRTAAFTDRGNLLPAMGFERGFEHTEAEFEDPARKVRRVRDYLDRASADEPLFVFFHTYAVHAPYLPPAPHAGLFTDPDYRGEFRRRYEELLPLDPLQAWESSRHFLDPFEGMGERDLDYLGALYDEGAHWADAEVGRLWRLWRERRDPENTLLVITSDHGEELGEDGRLGHRHGLSRALTHVPLLVRGPGLAAGHVVEAPVGLGALPATLLDLLELPAPELAQSASLRPLLEGGQSAAEPAFAQDHGSPRRGRLEFAAEGDLRLMRLMAGEGPQTWLHRWDEADDGSVDRTAELPEDERGLRAALDARRIAGVELNKDHKQSRVDAEADEAELAALGYTGED